MLTGAGLPAPFLGPKAKDLASGSGGTCQIVRPCAGKVADQLDEDWGPAGVGGRLRWTLAKTGGLVVVPVQPPTGSRCGALWLPDSGGFGGRGRDALPAALEAGRWMWGGVAPQSQSRDGVPRL